MKFKRNLLILSVILVGVLIVAVGCLPAPTTPTTGDVPTNGTISIAAAAVDTNDTTPTLTLSSTGATYMAFSGNGITWSAWVAYATTYSTFNITTGEGCTSGDGTKIVYVKFKNDVGESTKVYDSIVLDTVVLSSVSISPSTAIGTVGTAMSQSFTASALSTAAITMTSSCTFTWSISPTTGRGSLSATSGTTVTYTLPATGVTAGDAVITVSAIKTGTTLTPKTDTSTVTVSAATPPTPPTPLVDPAKLFVSKQTTKAKYTALPAGATSVTVYSDATKDPLAAVTAGVKATIILDDWWTTTGVIADNDYIYFMITYSDGTTSPVTYDGQLPDAPNTTALANIQATNKNTVTSTAAGNVGATDKISLYVGPVRYSEPTPLGTMTTAINLADTDAPLYTRTNVNGHESAVSAGADGIIVKITDAAYADNGVVAGKVEAGDEITITYSGNVTVTAASISFVLGGKTITANLTQPGLATEALLTITSGPHDLSAQATVNFNLANENIVDAAGGGNWAFEKDSDIVWTPGADF